MHFAVKMASVMVLSLASIATAVELTFDEVIKAAKGVKSYQYKETQFPEDHPPVTNRFFFKEPGIARIEYYNGTICIDARVRNKILIIDPNRKAVQLLIPLKDRPPYRIETDGSSILAERIRGWEKLFGKSKNLGQTIIDDRKAVKFQLSGKNGKITLWIDPETKLPFKAETWVCREDPFGPSTSEEKRVLFDYVYNPKFDDSLFSLTPPDGYKVEEQEVMMSLPTEKDFIQGLKVSVESNKNQFPDELTRMNLMEFVGRENEKHMMYMLNFARQQHFDQHDWRYVGQGVKLGEKDKPVYWYQPETGKPYRVVYGDLSVRDVPKDRLPDIPPATQPTTKRSAKTTGCKKGCRP